MQKEIGVLYITYDGLSDPLGQAQIIPYLKGLAKKNIKIVILSFEKRIHLQNTNLLQEMKQTLHHSNIKWQRLKYHQYPRILASMFDVFRGYLNAMLLMRKHRINIVHARGYISGFIAYCLKKTSKIKFIFDMRGFWPEEKVDAGLWSKKNTGYRIAKSLERKMLDSADQVVVLTQKAKSFLTENGSQPVENIEVIATCVDLGRFRPEQGTKCDSLRDKTVILYSGSIGTFYGFRDAADFFRSLRNKIKNAFFLALINNRAEKAEGILNSSNLPPESYRVLSLSHAEIAGWLRQADVSLMFYRRDNSCAGCCPTKFAESLASGVGVVANKNIGDCDNIIEGEKVGFVVEDFSDAAYAKTVDKLLAALEEKDRLRKRCRDTAERLFSLGSGVEKYLKVYHRLR